MKLFKKIIYICSIVLPILDVITGTVKGLKEGLKKYGNERFEKEQEEIYKNIKSQL